MNSSTRLKTQAVHLSSESEENEPSIYQKDKAKSKANLAIAKKTARKKETLNEQRTVALKVKVRSQILIMVSHKPQLQQLLY